MTPKYIKGQTTIDDIIEHILMRLNTDFVGGCLQVTHFCHIEEKEYYDTIMEMKVREKMYKHDVAKRCAGKGQTEHAIELRPKGAEVYENGGWKKYLVEFEKQEIEKQEREKQKYNQLHINAPIIGSQIGQGSDFGNLELSHNSIILETNKNVAVPKKEDQKTSELSIWQKIYKWTDHKTISIIIGAILGVLATWICKKLGIFQF